MDDLNDLVWNTANSKPQPNPNGYGRISPSNNFNNKPLGSAFQQSGSSPMQKPGQSFGSYGKTSLNSPTNTFLSTSPRSSSSGQSIPRKTSLNKLNSDPFENLVNLGGSAKKNNTANLSLEEQRKLQLEKQKAQTLGSRCSSPADQQFWEQLGNKSPKPVTKSIPLAPSRSFSPSGTSPTLNKQQSGGSVDPFDDLLGPSTNTNNSNGFAAKNSSPLVAAKPVAASTPANDPWNLDFLEKSSNTAKSESTSLADDDPFGLGAFTGLSPSPASPSAKAAPQRPSKRDSNPLGVLASPSLPKISVEEGGESSSSEEYVEETQPFDNRGKSPSPVDVNMDHLIAQVMEMGFEPEQARSALEFANNDVQAAIDILVENRNAEAEISHHKFKNIPSLPRRPEASRSSFDEDDYQHPLPAWRSGKKSPSGSQNRTRQDGEGAGFDMASFQMHKEKFMSNASTIGASVLSKANLFMKQASEKIRESIDDIQQRAENFQNEDDRFKRTGRPRWMQDYAEEDSSDDEVQNGYTRQKSRFADDRNPDLFSSPKSEKVDNESWNQRSQPHSANATRTSRAPKPPVSPGYQRTQKPAASPPPVAPKPQRPPRTVVAASPEQIQLSDKHKTAGNEKFKLGQFGGAEEMFSQAISALPAKHDNLILLHNNRAAARIKVGDYHGAVADCNLVVELVSDNYLYPSPNDPFNFKDQLVKALTRRGSANESKEKYEEAEKDFNKLLSIDPSNRSGLEGVRRCRKAIKMINGETEVKISNVSKSPQSSVSTDLFSLGQPSSSTGQAFQSSFGAQLDEFGFATIPASSTSNSRVSKEDLDKSEAVARLRAQDKFAEQEEEEKLRINDMVEDRLNQWRSNKIGNLRAMIASLDSILWPELNWKPCGLQDLIQPNQVKSKYMRAIAKLHPDKLATTETVEHKLLASGIFSTLNEAWDQFKAQNRL